VVLSGRPGLDRLLSPAWRSVSDGACSGYCSSRSILIVDDDTFGRETLGRILEVDGYRVVQAANAAAAMRYLHGQQHPGLILFDLYPPRGEGRHLVRALQSDRGLADIPVIVVSATERPSLSRSRGVIEHFEKPIAVPELLAAVHRYLPAD